MRKARIKKLYLERSEQAFRELVGRLVEQFSAELGIKPKNIFFRRLKTKWASCSARGNLTFNRLLCYLPQNLIKYVTYHELIHITDRKHDARFWNILHRKYHHSERLEKELLSWFLIQEGLKTGRITARD